MALDGNERRELYRKMINDPATMRETRKYSFTDWEKKLVGDENAIGRLAQFAVGKNWALDEEDFVDRYVPELKAPPAPKQQPAPKQEFMEAPSLEEQEAYIPKPQPVVGSPEYDRQLQAQYGGMKPTLGATFGGAPAVFETKEQRRQEEMSPVFKAHNLAFVDNPFSPNPYNAPVAEEQRRAQREFAKATKEQQKSALMGSTGFEYEQQKKAKERDLGGFSKDFAKSQLAMAKQIGENILTATKNQILEFSNIGVAPMGENEPEAKYYQREAARRGQEMYNAAAESERQFRDELAKRNIKTSVYDAIQKGELNRVPEAVAYTVGEAAMQMAAFYLTKGGSAYLQTLPQEYKDEVESIAAETNRTPEQVIAAGDDAPLTAKFSSGLQYAFEKLGMDQISKGIASRGGYRAVRDWMLKKSGNKALARAAGLGFITTAESLTEGAQTGISQAATLSTSQKPFVAKVNKFFKDPALVRERKEAVTAGAIGGLGLGGVGQAAQSAMDRTLFEAPKIGKATQRPDMDVVQTDNKIQERNKIAQAMEEAVKANPEAEGQIRQQYQKRINEAAPTDEEVLSAYDGLAVLPETEEKNTIRENLEAYMAEKGIAPQEKVETVSAEELQGPGYQIAYAKTREEIPQEYRGMIAEVERPTTRLGRFGPMEKVFAYRVPVETVDITAPEATTEEDIAEEIPFEEVPQVTEEAPAEAEEVTVTPEEEDFSFLDEQDLTPEEQAALLAQEETAPAEEEMAAEEVPAEPIAPEAISSEADLAAPQTREEIIRNNEKARQEYKKQRAEKREERLAKKQQLIDSGIPEDKATEILIKEASDEEKAFENSLPKVPELPKSQFQVDTEKNEADFKKMLQQTGAKRTNKAWGITQLGDSFGYEIGDKNGAIYIKPYEEEIDTEEGRENVVTGTAIELVYVPPNQRGVGKAKKLIQQVVDAADKTGTTLKIEAVPQEEEVDVAGLKKLYESFGFVFDDIYGTRTPKTAPVEKAAPKAPVKPAPKKEEAPKPAPKKEEKKPADKEETPKPQAPSTTPEIGTEVELPPQITGGSPRKMVYTKDGWRQSVGGEPVFVGESVQKQAQGTYEGKAEAKPVAEVKFKPNPNAAYYISKGADEVYYTLREIAGDDLDVHVMNLSKDLEESKRKAKELIGEDVEFDEASLGRDYNKIKADKTGKGKQLAKRLEGEGIADTLSFGKYYGKTIDEVFEADPSYILYLNKEYPTNTVFQKGVRDNPKIKEFIDQSLAEKEQQRKNLENLTEIGGIKFDDKGVAKAIPIKGKIKYINNRMGPQGMYRVYIIDTEYGIPVEVSGDIGKFADGKLEQGTELSFTANVQKAGDKFKVIGRKSEYTKPKAEAKPVAEKEEGKKPAPKEEWIGKTKEQYVSDRTSEILAATEGYEKKVGSKDKADQKTAAYLRDEANKKAEQEYDKLFNEALVNKTLPNEYKPNYLLTSSEKVAKDKKRYTEAGYPQNHNEKLSREEHKEEVQSAVDNGLYAKAIEDGVLSYDEATSIIESAGIKVPQSLTSAPSSTTSLASQVEEMRSLPPAKRKAVQQALEEQYGKEEVAKMIEITANFTKIIDDLEQKQEVKKDCP